MSDYKTFCKCLNCGGMAEVDLAKTVTALPPKYEFVCKNCGHTGYVDIYGMSNIEVNELNAIKQYVIEDNVYVQNLEQRIKELELKVQQLENNNFTKTAAIKTSLDIDDLMYEPAANTIYTATGYQPTDLNLVIGEVHICEDGTIYEQLKLDLGDE